MVRPGKFITIEGMEGVGKTTNITLVERLLADRGIDFITTREPGGTPLAESVRTLLLDHSAEQMEPVSELLLVFAARAQHVRQLIKPALEEGRWVVCDRFTDSTYAYQGAGRGLDASLIRELERLAIDDFQPDLTIVLDLAPEIGLARAEGRAEKDRFEIEGIDFFRRVRAGYLERAREFPRMRVVDADTDLESVAAAVAGIIREVCP